MARTTPGHVLSREQMEKLTTKRLVAYKNGLLKANDTGQDHYMYCPAPYVCKGECGWSKAHPEWKQAYAEVKSVLATREHVSRKKETS